MFKIQTLNTIADVGLNQFPHELYQLATTVADPDAILVRSHDMHKMTIPSSVKVIGRAGAGVNNIPVSQLTERGIPVFNTPGANANAVRELVIAGMLIASRHICQAWQYVSQLNISGAELETEIEKNKKQFAGFELMGKTLGVVGLGSVGVKVANAALHLGMDVIGYDPAISVNRAWELSSNVEQAHNIDTLLMKCDFISLHVPLTSETKHMIEAVRLHKMKKKVVILNFSRDGIIDNQALKEALDHEKVFAYVTDFPQGELMHHARVISLPHLGASTREAEENCAVMIVKQVRDFLEMGAISCSVNFPMMEATTLKAGVRLAIVNANIPNMVAQISSCLASASLNIASLSNKSRDDIAYTLIDVESDVNESVLTQISAIHGVVQVRKLLPRSVA